MKQDDRHTVLILSACGLLPVIWFALLTAPYISHGLFYVIEYLPEAMRNPFKIELCRDSLKNCPYFFTCFTVWVSAFTFLHEETTARERNTVLQNGAMLMK